MIEVRRATLDELDTCLAIRNEVFVLGQGVPPQIEVDGRDPECTHFLALRRGETVGTARLRITDEGKAKAERVAVRPGHQGLGVGRRLMALLEDTAGEMGHDEVVLSAQVQVVPFYEEIGYTAHGDLFHEAGIPHRKMSKRLAPED